jgi:DNA-binding MarR family transcriptional regulator
MQDRDWVTAEDIATFLDMNVTMAMLYISDLEKVNLVVRKQDGKDKKGLKFKLSDRKDSAIEKLNAKNGSEISKETALRAVRVYVNLYNSMIHKLSEVGGRSTLESIIDGGTGDIGTNRAKEIVLYLEKGGNLEGALEAFDKKLPSGGYTTANFTQVKGDFIEVLKKMIEALERFMGKLYGQHLTRTSFKPVIAENKELIHDLDLFAGLPRDYFPVGGT